MRLQLNWDDPNRGPQQWMASPPIAVGRNIDDLPLVLDGEAVERLVLKGQGVSRLHAVLVEDEDGVAIVDRSKNGTMVNGQLLHNRKASLQNGAQLEIGDYRLTLSLPPLPADNPDSLNDPDLTDDRTVILEDGDFETEEVEAEDYLAADSTVDSQPTSGSPESDRSGAGILDDATVILDLAQGEIALDFFPTVPAPPEIVAPQQPASSSAISFSSFPPPNFTQPDRVSIKELYATGDPVVETTFAALGGGGGQFLLGECPADLRCAHQRHCHHQPRPQTLHPLPTPVRKLSNPPPRALTLQLRFLSR